MTPFGSSRRGLVARTAGPERTDAWLVCLGAGAAERVRGSVGEGARLASGQGWASALWGGARLHETPDGAVTASVGDGPDAFSSAVVAADGGSVTLRCDPFGLRGAAAARDGGAVWCASDPRLLASLAGDELDARALHGYLCFSHVPSPLTLTAGVRALPAGAEWTWTTDGDSLREAPLWHEEREKARDEDAAAGTLRGLLREAVVRRLGDAREAAVFLSGGLDSSVIAALLAEAGCRVHLFTLDFGPPWDEELPFARQVAAHLGRPLHLVSARPRDIARAVEATAAALHQPFGDAVTVPLWLLGRAAAGTADVVFNGEGGDQLFGGWANKPMIAAELYGAEGYDREAAYLATYHRFLGVTDALYIPAARAAVEGIDPGAWVRPALCAGEYASLLHRLRAANLRLKGAQNIAPRCVQLAAAHGLRVHAPFFDHALAEWTFTLPAEWLLQGASEKHLLKRVADEYLPSDVVWRTKRGMGVPVTEWCLGPLRRRVASVLSTGRLRRDGWFDPAFVHRLRRGEDEGGEFRRRRVGEKLWALFMLHAWLDAR